MFKPLRRALSSGLVGRSRFYGLGGSALVAAGLIGAVAPAAVALNRTWSGGNADWNGSAGNWSPFDEPDFDDVAIFNTNNNVDMAIANEVMGLTLSGGIDLRTLNNILDVNGNITISGNSSLGVGSNSISVGSNLLEAYNITVNNNAELHLGATRIDLADPGGANNGVLDINTGGTFFGNGTLNSNDISTAGTFSMLTNDGVVEVGNYFTQLTAILAPPARTLTINAADATNARVDLDGTVVGENGVVRVGRNQTFDLNVPLRDTFNGTIELGHNSTFDSASAWILGGGGLVTVDNGFVPSGGLGTPAVPADVAVLTGGGLLQAGGRIEVVDTAVAGDEDGRLVIDQQFQATDGTIAVANGATIAFTGADATFAAGHNLDLFANAKVEVDGITATFNNANFDASGDGGADWIIRNAARVNWYVPQLNDSGGNDLYNGTLIFEDDVAGGPDQTLDIDVADGTAEIDRINVNSGTARIRSRDHDNITIVDVATVAAGAKLVLDSDSMAFDLAGELTGGGEAFFDEPVRILDDTTFSVNRFDMDNGNGSLRVETGATLTITSNSIETVNSLFQINGGTVDSTTDYAFGNGGGLLLSEGFTVLNPIYTGTGTVTFNSGATVGVSSDGARLIANTVFNEGSTIEFITNGSQLTLGETGKTTVLNGGDVVSTSTGNRLGTGGLWRVTGDTTITVDTLNWDDGATTIEAGGVLDLNVGNLDIGNDVYDNTLTFEGGLLEVDVASNTWTVDGNLNATNGGILRGDRLAIGNDTGNNDANLNVLGGTLQINAPVTFNADADVDIAAGATLLLNSSATVFNSVQGPLDAEFTGGGTLRVIGATVAEFTTIDMTGGTVALDGNLFGNIFAGDTTINAPLIVNAQTFDDFDHAGPVGSSDLIINQAGRLEVNLGLAAAFWRLGSNGTLIFNNTGLLNPSFLRGSDVVVEGNIDVNGIGRIDALLRSISGTIDLTNAGDELTLEGTGINRLAGTTINGNGVLRTTVGAELSGSGTINADIAANDFVIASLGTLVINGDVLDVHTLFVSNNATLELNSDFDTAVSNNGVFLTNINSLLTGTGVVTLNNRPLQGQGTARSRVINNDIIRNTAGTLTIDNALTDLDGTTEKGVLQTQAGGTLRLLDFNQNDTFAGRIEATGNGTVLAEGKELRFATGAGTVLLDNGTYETDTNHNFNGLLDVNAGTLRTTGGAVFALGGSAKTVLSGELAVDGTVRLVGGTTLNDDGGELVINPASLLRINNGVTTDAAVRNAGQLQINDTARGTTTLGNFEQTPSGTLNIDIANTTAGFFDRLLVDGTATLAGTLDVDFTFAAGFGDVFPFLEAGTISGTFTTLDVTGLGAGLDAVVNYTANAAILEIINAVSGIAGDYNDSGQVEQADLDLVLQNWGLDTDANGIPAGWTNGLPDGLIDQAELDGVLLNWGDTAGPDFSGSSVPEPTLLALSLTVTIFRRRGCRG